MSVVRAGITQCLHMRLAGCCRRCERCEATAQGSSPDPLLLRFAFNPVTKVTNVGIAPTLTPAMHPALATNGYRVLPLRRFLQVRYLFQVVPSGSSEPVLLCREVGVGPLKACLRSCGSYH